MDPMGVRYRYGRIGKTNTSPPVSRNIAFPRDLLLDFHYGSPPYFSFSLSLSVPLTLRSHALIRIVFFVRTIPVVVERGIVSFRDRDYR